MAYNDGNVSPFRQSGIEEQYNSRPNVEIIEQPARRIQFRYSCEHQSTSVIRGVDSAYPKIRINDHYGLDAIIVVSCVTKDPPYRVHADGLIGPGTRDGVLVGTPTITNEFELIRIGIQQVRCDQIDQAMLKRAQVRVPELDMTQPDLQIDPFGHGFHHAKDIKREDLLSVRLAFQVFVLNRDGTWDALTPIVSDPILDESIPTDPPQIAWLSDSSGIFAGGETIAIELKEKVEDCIDVVFFETGGAGEWKWQSPANIMAIDNKIMVIQTPPYERLSNENVNVFFVVRRLYDNNCSAPYSFQYVPKRQVMQPYQEPSSQDMLTGEAAASDQILGVAFAHLSVYPSRSSNSWKD